MKVYYFDSIWLIKRKVPIIPGGNGISPHGGATLNCRNMPKRDVEGTPEFLNITVSREYCNRYLLAYELFGHNRPLCMTPGNSHPGVHQEVVAEQ